MMYAKDFYHKLNVSDQEKKKVWMKSIFQHRLDQTINGEDNHQISRQWK